jgi:hypothetical protein
MLLEDLDKATQLRRVRVGIVQKLEDIAKSDVFIVSNHGVRVCGYLEEHLTGDGWEEARERVRDLLAQHFRDELSALDAQLAAIGVDTRPPPATQAEADSRREKAVRALAEQLASDFGGDIGGISDDDALSIARFFTPRENPRPPAPAPSAPITKGG